MILEIKRVLVLAPNKVDGEIWLWRCDRKIEIGQSEVHYVAFSLDRLRNGRISKRYLIQEVKGATKISGSHLMICISLIIPSESLPYHPPGDTGRLVIYQKDLKTDLVFLPYATTFSGHHTVAMEGMGIQAEHHSGLRMPWNNITFSTQAYVKLDSRYGHQSRSA
jgi:hypothetical protein